MSEIVNSAIEAVTNSQLSFCRFITANDLGLTGSHQYGFYIPKDSWQIAFDTPGVKGENKDCWMRIQWNNDFFTESRAIYYGKGTRNEYRITNFGRDFPFLDDSYSGSLLIVVKLNDHEYKAFVLDSDSDIDQFLTTFDISPADHNHLINPRNVCLNIPKQISRLVNGFEGFPSTNEMSLLARQILEDNHRLNISNPDKLIMECFKIEYELFKAFEDKEFQTRGNDGFTNCQNLIDYANSIINRRKSRAGKSLEHHLAYIFTTRGLRFEEQVVTEGNKKADFIFPDGLSYHNLLFSGDGLTFLGAKTTCKDRWRQVLNEANRIPHKYLFTLQPGISTNQLDEMYDENLTLVVPKTNISSFAASHRDRLVTLESFIVKVQDKQNKYYPL